MVIAFEVDRLRVVTAADIDPVLLARADPEWQRLSATGPRFVAALPPTQPQAMLESVQLAMAGSDLAAQPGTWRAMDASHAEAMWRKALPLAEARQRLSSAPLAAQILDDAIKAQLRGTVDAPDGTPELRAMSISSRQAAWTALIDRQGSIRASLPVDIP